MERTIRVTGKGKLSVKPDTIRLRINQEGVESEYEKAVAQSAADKEELTKSLGKLGFDKADLKTLYFNVDTKYDNYQTKAGNWRQRFLGYQYTHRMKLEFPADNQMLGKVLYQLARCASKPQFSIEFTVADPETEKSKLLAKAVKDAVGKAEVLSEAAGVKLLGVQTIDYSWGEIDFVSRPMGGMPLDMCCEEEMDNGSIDLDINADDINIEDTVTVVWGIE